MQLQDNQINELLELYHSIEGSEFEKSYRLEFLRIINLKGHSGIIEAFKAAKTKREQAVYCFLARLNGIKDFYLTKERL